MKKLREISKETNTMYDKAIQNIDSNLPVKEKNSEIDISGKSAALNTQILASKNKEQPQDSEPLGGKAQLFQLDNNKEQIKEKPKSAESSKQGGVCRSYCTIFSEYDVEYDNKLLNYPDLAKYCAQTIGLDSVLNHGSNLHLELIQEAASGNYDLAIAGLLSLDQL